MANGWISLSIQEVIHILPLSECLMLLLFPRDNVKMVAFELANGEGIYSAGTQTLECRASGGCTSRLQCHVAPVERPIISSGLQVNKGSVPFF